jgi:hypothetical protein
VKILTSLVVGFCIGAVVMYALGFQSGTHAFLNFVHLTLGATACAILAKVCG